MAPDPQYSAALRREGPHDPARTTRAHAGEAIKDTLSWPGYILIGISVVALVCTLVAAGYGFAARAWIALAVCLVCAALGVGWVLLERIRIKKREGRSLTDEEGH